MNIAYWMKQRKMTGEMCRGSETEEKIHWPSVTLSRSKMAEARRGVVGYIGGQCPEVMICAYQVCVLSDSCISPPTLVVLKLGLHSGAAFPATARRSESNLPFPDFKTGTHQSRLRIEGIPYPGQREKWPPAQVKRQVCEPR